MVVRCLKDTYYQGFAAQMAFYFILSIVPIMIVLSQMLGLVSISLNVLDDLIKQYASEEFAELLADFLSYTPTGPMNVFFLVVALWAASRAQYAMVRLANYSTSESRSAGKGYLRDRLKAFRTILFTLLTVTFTLIILVYGEMIVKLITSSVFIFTGAEYEIRAFWMIIRWPVAIVLYFLMVSYNYYTLPYEKVRFRDVLPGSFFSSAGMLVATFFYAIYMKYVGSFDIIYGSLASSVALIFWFFILSWAIVIGVLLNKACSDIKNKAASD